VGRQDEDQLALIEFTRQLLRTRAAQPLFRRGRFLTGAYNEELGVKDVAWLTPAGAEMTPEQWNDGNARSLGMLLDGRAQPTGIRRPGGDRTLLLLLNAHHEVVPFKVPRVPGGTAWRCLIDTNEPELDSPPPVAFDTQVQLAGRSLVLLELAPKRRRRRAR